MKPSSSACSPSSHARATDGSDADWSLGTHNRRPWSELGLEIGECASGCGTTLSRIVDRNTYDGIGGAR